MADAPPEAHERVQRTCGNCRFFRENTQEGATEKSGDCRFGPPRASESHLDYWPEVGDDAWCGRFERPGSVLPRAIDDEIVRGMMEGIQLYDDTRIMQEHLADSFVMHGSASGVADHMERVVVFEKAGDSDEKAYVLVELPSRAIAKEVQEVLTSLAGKKETPADPKIDEG